MQASPTPGRPPVPRVSGDQLVGADDQPLRLLGVDASGTEDACIEGKGFSWGALDAAEADGIASWHANAVRVPLNEDCWLGINGVPAEYSGAAYRSAVAGWVASLNAAGLVAILDLHWSAPGSIPATRQWPMADADHSVLFWTQVATAFRSDPSVMFDLYNEPYLGGLHPTAADWSCWLHGCTSPASDCDADRPSCTRTHSFAVAGMQELLDAVRRTGARQPVMVGGLNWAGDPCGVHDAGGDAGSCAWLAYEPQDPDHQLVASFHTYNWTACATATCWNSSVAPVAAKVPVVTGELGERDCSDRYVDEYMAWADAHGISYLAWSWELGRVPQSCRSANLTLLSDWPSTPNPANPVASAFRDHLTGLTVSR